MYPANLGYAAAEIFLSGLNYEIVHRPAAKNANADSLSCLPLPTERTALGDVDKLQINTSFQLMLQLQTPQ